MNGIGWVRDQCGKTEVLAGDPFVMRDAVKVPPVGWYLLFKAAPQMAAESERWEFCSVECIHAQTAHKAAKAAAEADYEARMKYREGSA